MQQGHARTIGPALRLIVILLLVGAAAVGASASPVSAGVLGWNTTTAVLPGETLTIDVTQPGVNIVNSSTLGQCPVQGFTTNIITYTCNYIGVGIPAGSHLVQEWADPSGKPLAGPFSETVTYNGSASVPVASSALTPCTQIGNAEDDPYMTWTCVVSTLQTQYPQALTVDLLDSDQSLLLTSIQGMTIDNPGQNGTTVVLSPYYALGTCGFDTNNSTPNLVQYINNYSAPYSTASGVPGEVIDGQQWGNELKAVFNCQSSGQGIPAPGGSSSVPTLNGGTDNTGSTLTLSVITSLTASLDTAQFVTYAQPPTPTTQTVLGPPAPSLLSVVPASGPAGATVTLSGTGLVAQAITFGADPGHGSTLGPSLGTKVQFGSQAETAGVCSSDGKSCTATVPTGGHPGDQENVIVANSAGQSNALTFTLTAGAALASTAAAATPSPTPKPQH